MPKTTLECLWVKCIGEAHLNFNIDHCGVCMPWWEWYPVCPTCGNRLKETTPGDWPLENRDSPHRLWCKTCRKHVAWTIPPVERVAAPEASKQESVPILNRSSELDSVKRGLPFTWGDVVAIHEVGPYAMVEYHPWVSVGVMVKTGVPDPDAVEFSTYVDGRNCSHSYGTLDAALAGCIAYRSEGPNHHADAYFIRSLGLEG